MNLESPETTPAQERRLSCFFCRELFSLYVENKLDESRRRQVEIHIAKCSSCHLLLDKITFSQKILKELSKTHPTAGLIDYVRKEQYFWAETFNQVGWKNWPPAIQWATQLTAVAVVLVLTIHFFPWLNVARGLYRIQKNASPTQVVAANPTSVDTDVDAPEAGPQGQVSSAGQGSVKALGKTLGKASGKAVGQIAGQVPAQVGAQVPVQVAVQVAVQASGPGAAAGVVYGPPVPDYLKTTPGPPSTVTVATTATANTNTNREAPKDIGKEETSKEEAGALGPAKQAGFVWKGSLKVDKITDDLTEKVTRTITALGGVKAGQVELGWHRNDQRYYHFIFPEDNYDRLLSELNSEGIVTLTRETHPRVIKQGHMRIIMTIEENE